MPNRPQSFESRIRELSPEKRAIFEKLAPSSSESARRAVAITPRRVSSPAPLSFAQQRLWFLDQLMPGTGLFNLSGAIRIGEALDADILERSVNEIVHRHESLRTTFKAVNGEPVSEILPHLWIELRPVDLRSLQVPEREDEAERLLAAAGGEPFDLATGPLLRTLLVRIDDEDYVFHVVMHHIVSDAWSLDIFWNELSTVWDCFAAGESSPLPELPLQYADFAVWERDWLSGPVLAELVSYWKGQLADLPVVELPTDWPRPPVPSGRGAVHYVTVPGSVTSGLKALGRQEGATLFMVLLAGFQTLLCRYSGRRGRSRRDVHRQPGPRRDREPDRVLRQRARPAGRPLRRPTFRELLRQVRRTALDAYSHQDLPFARLIRELAPERDLSRNPLFQVAFQLLNTPGFGEEEEADVERRYRRPGAHDGGPRSHVHDPGGWGEPGGRARVQHRLVRLRHDRGAGRVLRDAARRCCGRAGRAGARVAARRRRRQAASRRGVEPDGGGLPRRREHRFAVRGAGRAHS